MTQDISWWPEGIEYDEEKGHYVDPATGLRTYPATAKRAAIQLIMPEDLDEKRLPSTKDDEIFCRALIHQLHQNGEDVGDQVGNDAVVKAIQDLSGLGGYKARQKLYRLWHVGLIERFGQVHGQSGRPMKQSWQF